MKAFVVLITLGLLAAPLAAQGPAPTPAPQGARHRGWPTGSLT